MERRRENSCFDGQCKAFWFSDRNNDDEKI